MDARAVILPAFQEKNIRQAILDRYGVAFENKVMFMGIDIVFV
jgi:hypothetical protein